MWTASYWVHVNACRTLLTFCTMCVTNMGRHVRPACRNVAMPVIAHAGDVRSRTKTTLQDHEGPHSLCVRVALTPSTKAGMAQLTHCVHHRVHMFVRRTLHRKHQNSAEATTAEAHEGVITALPCLAGSFSFYEPSGAIDGANAPSRAFGCRLRQVSRQHGMAGVPHICDCSVPLVVRRKFCLQRSGCGI